MHKATAKSAPVYRVLLEKCRIRVRIYKLSGADDGSRTHTPFRGADFKSAASTVSPRPLLTRKAAELRVLRPFDAGERYLNSEGFATGSPPVARAAAEHHS